MSLAEIPALLILIGLVAYIALAGADFGAGFWYLLAGPGRRGRPIRDFTYHAMAPVWEANHVWLIFVLVVCWTAYPTAFGSIMSTLTVPLFIAAVGIILRGTTYALRSGRRPDRETEGVVGFIFGASSVLTPYALGAAIGGIASGRVPVGNAKGDLVTSWINATSIMTGVMAVAVSAYLAAVYLAGDAVRAGEPSLEGGFRRGGLAMGALVGPLAAGGLVALREDARSLFDELTSGAGLAAVLVSAAAGLATILLLRGRRYEPARFSAALAVAAVVAGWGIAQQPDLLPGLTVDDAAADHATLVALLVSLVVGSLILVPALALLFGLVLRGRFDEEASEGGGPAPVPPPAARPSARRALPAALALLVVGLPLALLAEGLLLGIGFVALAAFVVVAALGLLDPASLGDEEGRDPAR